MTDERARKQAAEAYLAERTGTLEYRFLRYAAVADALFAHGLNDTHLLMDVGAGMCDFDFYLRTVRGWKGRYLPVDAAINGIDLNEAHLPADADYTTCIEVLEHLHTPMALGNELLWRTRKSGVVVVTTPNTNVLGTEAVKAMDRTHVTPIFQTDLQAMGFHDITVTSFFGGDRDSLLAVAQGKTA